MPPLCVEARLDACGRRRACVLDRGHDGDHQDLKGESWEPPGVTLARLKKVWGHTHRIVWTGTLWVATAHSRAVPWRTEVEPTPAQLEERLRRRHGQRDVPEQRKPV
ncbi:hypothetical protein [Nocardiopsis tropica]